MGEIKSFQLCICGNNSGLNETGLPISLDPVKISLVVAILKEFINGCKNFGDRDSQKFILITSLFLNDNNCSYLNYFL